MWGKLVQSTEAHSLERAWSGAALVLGLLAEGRVEGVYRQLSGPGRMEQSWLLARLALPHPLKRRRRRRGGEAGAAGRRIARPGRWGTVSTLAICVPRVMVGVAGEGAGRGLAFFFLLEPDQALGGSGLQ